MEDKKKSIFNHIFYEFDMYLYTYTILLKLNLSIKDNPNIQNELQRNYNAYWESHLVHTRNLIEFFTNRCKDSIGTQTVLKIEKDFTTNKYNEYYKNICQTVDHLTIERTNGQIMAEQSLDAIAELSEAIPNLIKDFLITIDDNNNVKDKYIEDLNKDYNLSIRNYLKTILGITSNV